MMLLMIKILCSSPFHIIKICPLLSLRMAILLPILKIKAGVLILKRLGKREYFVTFLLAILLRSASVMGSLSKMTEFGILHYEGVKIRLFRCTFLKYTRKMMIRKVLDQITFGISVCFKKQ